MVVTVLPLCEYQGSSMPMSVALSPLNIVIINFTKLHLRFKAAILWVYCVYSQDNLVILNKIEKFLNNP